MGTGKATRKDTLHKNVGDIGGGQGQIDAQRALLGFMTLGTSEIKTGAGKYGDETVADSLFPKEINNMMLNDRQAAREDADGAAQAEVDKASERAANVPDATSVILKKAMGRRPTGQGRKSTFLTGAMGGGY